MGKLAIVSFAARLSRVGKESALGDVRVFALVAAAAFASLGKVEAERFGCAFPVAFRGRSTFGGGLALRAGVVTGWSVRVSFVVTAAWVPAVGVVLLRGTALEAGRLRSKDGGAALGASPVCAPPGTLIKGGHDAIGAGITLALVSQIVLVAGDAV